MTSLYARKLGTVLGSLMGDALALGSHWHYDLEKRDSEVYPGGIQGFDRPARGHYHDGREPGEFTHYGDGAMILLLSIVRNRGFDVMAYAHEFKDYFSVYSGYLDKATKAVIENANSGTKALFWGGSDDQTGGLSRNGLVALASGTDNLETNMADVCAISQKGREARDAHLFHGHVIHALLKSLPIEEAVALAADTAASAFVQEALEAAQSANGLSVVEATGKFGRACRLQSTLPSVIHAVLRHGDDPQACLMEIVRAGGDNASRAMVAGSWLGAAHGLDGLPASWLERVTQKDEALALGDKLVALSE